MSEKKDSLICLHAIILSLFRNFCEWTLNEVASLILDG